MIQKVHDTYDRLRQLDCRTPETMLTFTMIEMTADRVAKDMGFESKEDMLRYGSPVEDASALNKCREARLDRILYPKQSEITAMIQTYSQTPNGFEAICRALIDTSPPNIASMDVGDAPKRRQMYDKREIEKEIVEVEILEAQRISTSDPGEADRIREVINTKKASIQMMSIAMLNRAIDFWETVALDVLSSKVSRAPTSFDRQRIEAERMADAMLEYIASIQRQLTIIPILVAESLRRPDRLDFANRVFDKFYRNITSKDPNNTFTALCAVIKRPGSSKGEEVARVLARSIYMDL